MFNRFFNSNNHNVCTSNYASKAMWDLDFISNSISTRKPWKMQDYFHYFMMSLCLYCILCRRSWGKTVCSITQIQHGQLRVMWKSCTWFIHFILFLPTTLSYLHVLQHGSEVLAHGLLHRQWICQMNPMETIGYWLGEFETHSFIRCSKQNVRGKKQTAERGIK